MSIEEYQKSLRSVKQALANHAQADLSILPKQLADAWRDNWRNGLSPTQPLPPVTQADRDRVTKNMKNIGKYFFDSYRQFFNSVDSLFDNLGIARQTLYAKLDRYGLR